jgi:hypothetical protein
MDGNALGNTETRAADDAGDIGAVAVAVVSPTKSMAPDALPPKSECVARMPVSMM